MIPLQQLSDHVWYFPPDKDSSKVQPAIGIICTQTQTVLVDAGNSPAHARRVMQALGQINAPPLSYIIYTHHHWDHIFGACAYGVPVTAQRICYEAVVRYAQNDWSPENVRRTIVDTPELAVSFTALNETMGDDWDRWQIVFPTTILEKKTNIVELDGLTLEIEHIGGTHAADSTLVTVREDGVMFLGDCFYPPPAHIRKPDDVPDVDMLVYLLDRGLTVYADGHTGAYKGETWRAWLESG